MTFNDIWIEHKIELLKFIKTKINKKHIAEDILQEVSLKLLSISE